MITKSDCLLLLGELKASGLDTIQATANLVKSPDIPIDVIKFINDNRLLELTKFYEKLRKSYNSKKSSLYINIIRGTENPKDMLTTLAALNLLILLYAKNVDNILMFLRHSRFEEINSCLLNYSKTFDIIPCLKLLNLIKADIKVLDYIQGKDRTPITILL